MAGKTRKQHVKIDWIKAKLEEAESRGFTNDSKAQLLAQAKSRLE